MQIDLNIFIKKLVTYLKQKYVGRHTRNSAYITTSAVYFKEISPPDSDFLHTTIKYAAQSITFTTIRPNNIIIMMCFGFL